MFTFSRNFGLVFLVAASCLGTRTAHAQANPLTYWTPGWPMGFSGNEQNLDSYGNFPSFDGSDARGGRFSYMRYNFPNGTFIGNESGTLGLRNGFGAGGAFGDLHYDGVQFGYNFKSGLPMTVYGGFDTVKYNSGLDAALSAPFNSTSSSAATAYTSHVGVEFRPTSNLSLSFGGSFTQQQSGGLVDSDINSSLPPGASPLAFGHR